MNFAALLTAQFTLVGVQQDCASLEYGEPRPVVVPALDGCSVPGPVKVVAFVAEGPAERKVRSAMRGRLDVVRTGPLFLELMAPGVTKGAALARLMAAAGVPRGEVLAIGDHFNDLSMFEVAGLGVAMANAPWEVRESAGAVTADCTDDGVAAALRRHVLNGASVPGRGLG